jgi:hypothetical protein
MSDNKTDDKNYEVKFTDADPCQASPAFYELQACAWQSLGQHPSCLAWQGGRFPARRSLLSLVGKKGHSALPGDRRAPLGVKVYDVPDKSASLD